jgi:hypothetical protein
MGHCIRSGNKYFQPAELDLTKLTGLDLAKLRATVNKAEELLVSAKLTTEGWILLTTMERTQMGGVADASTMTAQPFGNKPLPENSMLPSLSAQSSPDSVVEPAINEVPSGMRLHSKFLAAGVSRSLLLRSLRL